MYRKLYRSIVGVLCVAGLLAFPVAAQHGQGQCACQHEGECHGEGHGHGHGHGQHAGKGMLMKTVLELTKLNTTKGYELTAAQAKQLLPTLRKMAVTETMNRDESVKYIDSLHKVLTEKQRKKLDALTSHCSNSGPTKLCSRGGHGHAGPQNPFYVKAGTKPQKGSAAEALRKLIAALQKKK